MPAARKPRTIYGTALFKLVSATFPEFRSEQGVFGVEKFAAAIGMSGEGVYKWFRADKLSVEGVSKIVGICADPKTGNPRLAREDLFKFCFPA